MAEVQVVDFKKYRPAPPEIYAYKCSECGTLHYPAPMICWHCSNRRDPSGVFFSSWETAPLGGMCKLLTWTRVYNLPEGFDDRCLLFGIVEFANGLRASGRLMVEEPNTGMELSARTGVVREAVGQDVYGLMFYAPGK
jgi:uncharacterized OB-fold protein